MRVDCKNTARGRVFWEQQLVDAWRYYTVVEDDMVCWQGVV
jgi:hypothetical protein